MKFYSLYGFMREGKLAVLEPKAEPQTYKVEGDNLQPLPHDLELESDALALLTTASHLYQEQRHDLPISLAGN